MIHKEDNISDTSSSGFVEIDVQGENSKVFTEMSVVETSGCSLLIKAKRYGKWWMLKGLKEEYREQTFYKELLKKEFDISVQLQNPNIVFATSKECVDGIGDCIVFEWIDGVTLKE